MTDSFFDDIFLYISQYIYKRPNIDDIRKDINKLNFNIF